MTLETMIRDIVRSELKAAIATSDTANKLAPKVPAPGNTPKVLTSGQKAARTRKLRAAGYKAWETRRRNEASAVLVHQP